MATNESEISSEIYSSFGVLSSELVSEILALACNSEVLQLCTSHFAKVNSQFQSSCKGALRRCQRLQYVEHTFLLMLAKRGGARKFHKVFKSLMSNTGNLCTVDISGSCSISDEDVLILVAQNLNLRHLHLCHCPKLSARLLEVDFSCWKPMACAVSVPALRSCRSRAVTPRLRALRSCSDRYAPSLCRCTPPLRPLHPF
mmetsp:Transcript_8058/g.19256  ORF Transcript_8058/g.19256 Transcript_8058/m.19256 type:complete len:200 (+) Transcript_8058:91-690(+)